MTPSASTIGVCELVPTRVSGNATPSFLHDGAHALQVDLVEDAVPGRDHVDVLERLAGPFDEVEAVFVAAVLDGAVFREGVRIEAAALDGQRVVDDQLRRHDRVHQRRIAAFLRDGVAQAGQVDEGRLAEDVVADDARREPREIEIAAALDDLLQRRHQRDRVAAAHEVFGQYARGVREGVPGAGLDLVDCRAGVEVMQAGAVQGFAIIAVHDEEPR
jgi:hypothetical protein